MLAQACSPCTHRVCKPTGKHTHSLCVHALAHALVHARVRSGGARLHVQASCIAQGCSWCTCMLARGCARTQVPLVAFARGVQCNCKHGCAAQVCKALHARARVVHHSTHMYVPPVHAQQCTSRALVCICTRFSCKGWHVLQVHACECKASCTPLHTPLSCTIPFCLCTVHAHACICTPTVLKCECAPCACTRLHTHVCTSMDAHLLNTLLVHLCTRTLAVHTLGCTTDAHIAPCTHRVCKPTCTHTHTHSLCACALAHALVHAQVRTGGAHLRAASLVHCTRVPNICPPAICTPLAFAHASICTQHRSACACTWQHSSAQCAHPRASSSPTHTALPRATPVRAMHTHGTLKAPLVRVPWVRMQLLHARVPSPHPRALWNWVKVAAAPMWGTAGPPPPPGAAPLRI